MHRKLTKAGSHLGFHPCMRNCCLKFNLHSPLNPCLGVFLRLRLEIPSVFTRCEAFAIKSENRLLTTPMLLP